jgi:hypothetical protein
LKVWRNAGSGSQFQALLSRLLVKEAIGEPFFLQNLIVPVALVDPPTLTATLAPSLQDIPATAGEQTPLANARLADTGQLAAGQYNVTIWAHCDDNNYLRIRRRNGSDAADIWVYRMAFGGNIFHIELGGRMVFGVNERLVVENVNAATGGRVYTALIWTQGPF